MRILAALTGSSYLATVLGHDPLFYWRFGEASGDTALDSSPNGFNGTYANSPTLGVAGLLTGDTDTAVSFTAASTQSVTSNDPSFGLGTNMPNSTWEFWIKSSDTTDLFSLIGLGGGGSQLVVEYDGTTDVLSVGLFDTEVGGDAVAGDVEGTATTNLNDGNPHHLVVRVDSTTTFSVWLDGVSKTVTYSSQVQLDAPTAPTGSLITGQGATFTLDEFAAYDHRLSDDQIAAHYLSGTSRSTPTVDDLVDDAAAIAALQDQITDAYSLINSLAEIPPP